MKRPLIITAVICMVVAFLGWREREKHSGLRLREQQIQARLQALGVSGDLSVPLLASKVSDRSQRNDASTVRVLADRMIGFSAKFLEAKENNSLSTEFQKEVMDVMSHLMELNSEQMRLLVEDLNSRPGLAEAIRKNAIGLSIVMLAEQYPQQALSLFGKSSDLLKGDYTASRIVSGSIVRWAEDDPDSALRWIEQNKQKSPDLVNDDLKASIVQGAARKDIGLAIQLMGELEIKDGWEMISGAVNSPEQQISLLAALRKKPELTEDHQKGMELLARTLAGGSFDEADAFLKANSLSREEASALLGQLDYSRINGDCGRWLDWCGSQALDENQVKTQTEMLVSRWTNEDYKAAGEWLNQAKSGPIKEAAVRSYIETVATYDADVAVQWAETLPASQKEEAMNGILDQLKHQDQAAAEAFARKHHLEFSTEGHE